MNGADLSPLLDGKQPPRRRYRTAASNDHVNVRDGRWLLIAHNQGGERRFYDTKADPGERRRNVAASPDQVRRLWGYIKRDAGNDDCRGSTVPAAARTLAPRRCGSTRLGRVRADALTRSGCPRPAARCRGGRAAPDTSRSVTAG